MLTEKRLALPHDRRLMASRVSEDSGTQYCHVTFTTAKSMGGEYSQISLAYHMLSPIESRCDLLLLDPSFRQPIMTDIQDETSLPSLT